MSKCLNCWNCDFDPANPDLHNIVMEEDYLTMAHPGATPKQIRVPKTCFAGQTYVVSVPYGEHGCPSFVDFKERQKTFLAEDEAARAAYTSPTSRTKLLRTTNLFKLMQDMQEGDEPSWEIMTDVLGQFYEHGLYILIINMNDMNIRGLQMASALEFSGDLPTLMQNAIDRNSEMVAYVNANYADAATEEAVVRNAHRHGHKKRVVKFVSRKTKVAQNKLAKKIAKHMQRGQRGVVN